MPVVMDRSGSRAYSSSGGGSVGKFILIILLIAACGGIGVYAYQSSTKPDVASVATATKKFNFYGGAIDIPAQQGPKTYCSRAMKAIVSKSGTTLTVKYDAKPGENWIVFPLSNADGVDFTDVYTAELKKPSATKSGSQQTVLTFKSVPEAVLVGLYPKGPKGPNGSVRFDFTAKP